MLPERSLDLFALVEAQKSSVDKNACQLISDCAMNQGRGNRRINSAGKSADHARVADGTLDSRNFRLDICARRPARLGLADAEEKIRNDLSAARRVRNLWMKLHCMDWLGRVTECGDWISFARCRGDVSVGRRLDVIAVTHPRRKMGRLVEALEQPFRFCDVYLRPTVLPSSSAFYVCAKDERNELHSVTNAKYRGDVEHGNVRERSPVGVDRIRTAAKNDSVGLPLSNPFYRARRRMNLRVDSRLPDTPRDELSVLRPEVQYEYPAAHRVMISTSLVSRSRIAEVHLP